MCLLKLAALEGVQSAVEALVAATDADLPRLGRSEDMVLSWA